MSVGITIKSRKLGETLYFIAHDSGNVFVNPTPTSWGQQVFDRNRTAEAMMRPRLK